MNNVIYPKPVRRRAIEMGLSTATIAVGKGIVWQGVVDPSGAKLLMDMIEAVQDRERDIVRKDNEELAPYAEAIAEAEAEEAARIAAEAAASPPPAPARRKPKKSPPASKPRRRQTA